MTWPKHSAFGRPSDEAARHSHPWHHRDPFDRMLIAQAQATGLTFLTADQIASLYGDFVLLVR
jgi:PIN domain nuclease of toxin-antitoxin system